MGGHADTEALIGRRVRFPVVLLLLAFTIGASTAVGGARGDEIDYVYGFELSTTEFDEELFEGSTAAFSGYIAVIFKQHYQFGLRIHDSIFFTPSLDRGEELSGDDDLLDISARVFYLQREWPVAERFRLHAMIGFSRVEIEDEEFVCPPFFPCLPLTEPETTYRNRESGLAYGFGGSWIVNDTIGLSLRYIDYSDSGFDYRTVHFGFNVHTNQ